MLSAGTCLGSYEVIALLGAGGMGEVYRARDARLGRDVALKILPSQFASDPERLARFKREAQVLASLAHPNIGAIFGLEDGSIDGAHLEALVLELVEGETLADRISRGAIPLDEALPIARQIAEALEAAHAQGVIHRDLKPANVKITPAGIVKVLDFGLAKFAESEAAASATAPVSFSISPTITSPAATGLGVVIGTAAYMSPEQAKGRPADRYSDMWAFGAVLYEMLTGRRAFEGEDIGETLAEVIKANVSWDALPADTPPAIRRVLKRCLVKERKARISDAAMGRLELEEAANELKTPTSTPVAGKSRSQWRWVIPVAAAVIAALLSGAAVWRFSSVEVPRDVGATRFAIDLPPNVSIGLASRRVAITRDGRRIVYAGARATGVAQLYSRSIDQLESIPFQGTEGVVTQVFLSPDGQWIGYVDVREAKLKKVRVSGGPPATIYGFKPGTLFSGASWGTNGRIVFATSESPALMEVADSGGVAHVLSKPLEGETHAYPQFLPDGRGLLFVVVATGKPDKVAVLKLEGGEQRVLFDGDQPRFSDTGHVVYLRERALWAVPFDTTELAVIGDAVPVLEGIGVFGAQLTGASFDIAATGTLVYVPETVTSALVQRSLVWVDRNGREEPLPAPLRPYGYPRLSPDGTQIALDIRDQDNDIWLWSLARGTLSRLTFDRAFDRVPVWTPDGRRILFQSERVAGGALYWQPFDGTGTAEALAVGAVLFPSVVSPDGKALYSAGSGDLMSVTLDGTKRVETLMETPFLERNPITSPDGRWMAYESNASGRPEIYVRPYPKLTDGQWQVSTGGGSRPLWAHSGRELFYLAPDGAVMSVAVAAGATWSAGVPKRLFAGAYLNGDVAGFQARTYDIALDDRRFLMIKEQGPSAAATGPGVIVVENWTDELKKLAK